MSDTSQTPTALIDQLRAWFHPKDRSVQLAVDCWTFMNTATVQTASLARMPLSMAGIAETSLTALAASVTFSSLPQTYRQLLVFIQARSGTAAPRDQIRLQFNGDGGANYDYELQRANDVTSSAVSGAGGTSVQVGNAEGSLSTASMFGYVALFIPMYSSTKFKKDILSLSIVFGDNQSGNFYLDNYGGNWHSAAAINSMTFFMLSGDNFIASSSFQVYGVL